MPITFSIVVPAYNEEHYLGDCLDAAFRAAAGRNDVEIIVVDNNSTDRTRAIAEERAARQSGDGPTMSVLAEPRPGANRTRETGFEAARGAIVAFIDADTKMPPDWIVRVERAFARDPKLVCVSGPFIYYDLPLPIRALVRTFYFIALVVYGIGRALFRRTTIVQGGNYAVRRDAFAKIGGQNVEIAFYGDDTDNAIRLSRIGTVKFMSSLTMPTSGRRLAKEGAFTMGFRYTMNNIWMTIFRRPFTREAKEVRFGTEGTVYRPVNRFREGVIAAITMIVLLAVIVGIISVIFLAGRALFGG